MPPSKSWLLKPFQWHRVVSRGTLSDLRPGLKSLVAGGQKGITSSESQKLLPLLILPPPQIHTLECALEHLQRQLLPLFRLCVVGRGGQLWVLLGQSLSCLSRAVMRVRGLACSHRYGPFSPYTRCSVAWKLAGVDSRHQEGLTAAILIEDTPVESVPHLGCIPLRSGHLVYF